MLKFLHLQNRGVNELFTQKWKPSLLVPKIYNFLPWNTKKIFFLNVGNQIDIPIVPTDIDCIGKKATFPTFFCVTQNKSQSQSIWNNLTKHIAVTKQFFLQYRYKNRLIQKSLYTHLTPVPIYPYHRTCWGKHVNKKPSSGEKKRLIKMCAPRGRKIDGKICSTCGCAIY